jgi:hypothetical protein
VLLAAIALAVALPSGPASAATSTLRIAGSAKELSGKTKAAAKVDKRARTSAKKVFRGDPALRARILPEGLDPGASRRVEVTNRDGSTATFTLDPAAIGEFEIGRAVDLGRDRSNLVALYSMLHRRLPAGALGGLPPPQVLATLPAGRVRKGFLALGQLIVRDFDVLRAGISETIPAIMAANPIGDCHAEYGWESPASELASRCDVSEYAADGIIRNVDFALEDSLTCVKSQGDRGSCSAHAIVAGVETAAMASGGGPENLSEQSTYFYGKVGANWTKRYGSGMPVGLTLEAMSSNGWRFPLESDWNYNQSIGIQDLDPVTNQRPGSCSIVYYGEMCTDYEFQAVERIELFLGLPTLVEYDFPAAASNSGHQVTSWASIPDFDVPPGGSLAALQLETVALLVESRTPVVAGIAVPDAFLDPADGGYVRNVAGQVSYGEHAILLVGFVANADLPAGVAADTGPLGGYFVAKNSWATWWGDCGFAYVASDFLDTWGTAYHALEID